MSNSPTQPATHQGYVPPPPPQSNGLGIFGFIVSLLGLLLTCGLLSPLGLLISLIGLFKAPRGFAIGGTILGLIGSIWLGTMGLTFIAAIMAGISAVKTIVPREETEVAIGQARGVINEYRTNNGSLPDGEQGNKLIIEIKDGWQHPLRYEGDPGKDEYVVRSKGPDDKWNTADDITKGVEGTTEAVDVDLGSPVPADMPPDSATIPDATPGTPLDPPEPTP